MDLDKIKVHILEGDYKSAITEGERLMAQTQQSPELDELYYLLGLSYLKEGNYLRASDIFEIIIKEFRGSAFNQEAQIGLGDAYFLLAEYAKAQGYYEEFIEHNRQSKLIPPVLYRLSLCAAKAGRAQEARERLERLSREYPASPETSLEQDLGVSAGSFYYTVQVGAFSETKNAESLMQELTAKGYPAYIFEEAGKKAPCRVRVGKLPQRSQAVELQEKLSQEGYPTKILP